MPILAPPPSADPQWPPTCEYCARQATLIGRDSGDVLCRYCGLAQYADPKSSLAALTVRTLAMYGTGSAAS